MVPFLRRSPSTLKKKKEKKEKPGQVSIPKFNSRRPCRGSGTDLPLQGRQPRVRCWRLDHLPEWRGFECEILHSNGQRNRIREVVSRSSAVFLSFSAKRSTSGGEEGGGPRSLCISRVPICRNIFARQMCNGRNRTDENECDNAARDREIYRRRGNARPCKIEKKKKKKRNLRVYKPPRARARARDRDRPLASCAASAFRCAFVAQLK